MPTNHAARERWASFTLVTIDIVLDLEMQADRLKAKFMHIGTNTSLLILQATTIGTWMTRLTTQYQTHLQAIKKPVDQECEHVNDKGESTTKAYHAGRHGWYNKCSRCGARWKWNNQAREWQHHPEQSRGSSSRPPPLSATTMGSPPSEAPAGASAKTKAKAKAKAAPSSAESFTLAEESDYAESDDMEEEEDF